MSESSSIHTALRRRTLGIGIASVAFTSTLSACASGPSSGTSGSSGTTPITIPVQSRKLSGRAIRARTVQSRGLVIAIHGGGYTSKYFDTAGQSAMAFLAEDGFDVVGVDRPGYGAAKDWLLGFDDQVAVLSDAVAWARQWSGAPAGNVFLYGHSIGGMLSLLMARKAPEQYLGISMTGSGAVFHERAYKGFESRLADPAIGSHSFSGEAARRALFMAQPWTYDTRVATLDPERDVPSLVADLRDALRWQTRLLAEGRHITVPVHFAVGESDGLWRSDAAGMQPVQGLFTAAPFSEVHVQRFAGHCVELHRVYRAHVQRIIAFIDQCQVVRRHQAV